MGKIHCIIGSFFHLASNMPAKFQRMMDQILCGLPFAQCYMDDVIIFSRTPHEHVRHLQVFLNGCSGGGCACTIASTSFSMTN